MIWCATEREKIKEAEPTLKQTEIMAKLGQLWRDMSGASSLALLSPLEYVVFHHPLGTAT